MSHLSLLRCCALLASFGLVVSSAALSAQNDNSRHGRKYKAPPPSSRIEVTILKADSLKPIADAHVIFHPIEGDKDKGYLELKTNEEGKAVIDVLPIGDTVRLQVIANGYQTYGSDYQVDQPKLVWQVCLKRPSAQYSIYKNHPTSNGASTCPDQTSGKDSAVPNAAPGDKTSESSQSTALPAVDKPANSAGESDPQPDSAQPRSN